MMKKMKRLLMLLLIAAYSVAAAPRAMAGEVVYTGDGGQIIFLSGSEYIETDLFTNYKDVMPGDVIHQRVRLSNEASDAVDVNVYLRSQGVQAGSADFLHQMNLRVLGAEDVLLFDAPADESAQLMDWVHLGEVHPGDVMDLNLTLTVPTTMDNRYQNQAGCVVWEFWILETPADDGEGEIEDIDPENPLTPGMPPQTGDDSNIRLFIGLFAGSGVMLLLLFLLLIKRKKDEEEEEKA